MSLNKPSELLVIDLINQDNNRSFTDAQINIRSVLPYNGARDRNSRAVGEGIEGSGYFGTQPLFYNRLELDTVLANNDPEGLELMVPNDGQIDTVEVLDRLNRMFSLQLREDDVIKTAVDTEALPATITLQASPDSLAWLGSKIMTFVPDRPMWAPTFASLVLDGFKLPTGDVSALTDPVATPNSGPTFRDEEGHMMFGTDVPATAMLMSTNSELELGIGARNADGSIVFPDSDNSYTLALLDQATWKVVYSVGLLDEGDLNDLYTTCLVITRTDNTTCTLVLKKTGAVYEWECVDKGVLIPVDHTDGDGGLIQGFLDAETLREALMPAANSSAGAPLGAYSVRLQARRKNSIAPRLIATILIKAYNN
ncbi:hypothetical protein [Xanthomonas phage RTH11]|nr:hypothetical protein [Xanthomonas phage RTH11]